MEFIQLFMALLGVACLIVFFVMAPNISKIATSSKNTEQILKRMLEIQKEESNETKAKDQMADQFAKYKGKI
jgi:type III secretory pathway component EscR